MIIRYLDPWVKGEENRNVGALTIRSRIGFVHDFWAPL